MKGEGMNKETREVHERMDGIETRMFAIEARGCFVPPPTYAASMLHQEIANLRYELDRSRAENSKMRRLLEHRAGTNLRAGELIVYASADRIAKLESAAEAARKFLEREHNERWRSASLGTYTAEGFALDDAIKKLDGSR